MREKCRFGGIKKTVAVLAASIALFRADPLVERVDAKEKERISIFAHVSCEIEALSGRFTSFSPPILDTTYRDRKAYRLEFDYGYDANLVLLLFSIALILS